MTMRTAGEDLTVCEYLRLINDLCQGEEDKDKLIREYCYKGEKIGKMLGREVSKRNPSFLKKPNLYQKQKGWRDLITKRISKDYKVYGD